MTDQAEIDRLEKILNSEDDTPVRITPDGRVVPEASFQGCPTYTPTVQIRWMLSPTPGERPRLQQLFLRADESTGLHEEWLYVQFVDCNGTPVV